MTHRGEYIYQSTLADLEGRNAEIEALKVSLLEAHGPGEFTARRVNAEGRPDEFGDRIQWVYRT